MIVEFNKTKDIYSVTDYRVLLRIPEVREVDFVNNKNESFKAKANMCFVISLKTFEVITLYWNLADDKHDDIN